jgi:hypothetical protein
MAASPSKITELSSQAALNDRSPTQAHITGRQVLVINVGRSNGRNVRGRGRLTGQNRGWCTHVEAVGQASKMADIPSHKHLGTGRLCGAGDEIVICSRADMSGRSKVADYLEALRRDQAD